MLRGSIFVLFMDVIFLSNHWRFYQPFSICKTSVSFFVWPVSSFSVSKMLFSSLSVFRDSVSNLQEEGSY